MEKQLVMDLNQPKTDNMTFRIQPSLKAVFKDRCANDPLGPKDPSDLIRRFMAEYIEKTKQGRML